MPDPNLTRSPTRDLWCHSVAEHRPLVAEWTALAAVFVAAIAFSLIRIDMTDTPWHLSTARLAFTMGHWPISNTFSYTYADYPLNQQYPIYQTLLYFVYSIGEWEGLSLLNSFFWIVIFGLWILWGGSLRCASILNVAWFLGLLGLQRRMVLRPDLMTFFLLILLLHLIDMYRKGRTWIAALFVPIQLFMANSHQLFPLGLAVQGGLLFHLFVVRGWGSRWGISTEDRNAPIWPVGLALAGSALACLGTPLGLGIVNVTSHTLTSLSSHREHVQEFAPFYLDPYATVLVILATSAAIVGFFRRRMRWQPFEAFLWILAIALLWTAIRGMPYYLITCVSIFARSFCNLPETLYHQVPYGRWPKIRGLARVVCAILTIELCLFIVYMRWVSPPRILGGTQPGIGLALGVWPQSAIDFIKRYPPPGRMFNISWYSGNPLIWELYPEYQVFVDPRFETYPRGFLLEAIRAETDQIVLEGLLSDYQPSWIVGWIKQRTVRERLASLLKEGRWCLVHADTVFMILVRNTPENQWYIAAHRILPQDISPTDFLESEPDLLALQQIRIAGLYRDLGLPEKSQEMIQMVEATAHRFPEVRNALATYLKEYTK